MDSNHRFQFNLLAREHPAALSTQPYLVTKVAPNTLIIFLPVIILDIFRFAVRKLILYHIINSNLPSDNRCTIVTIRYSCHGNEITKKYQFCYYVNAY